MEGFMDGQYMYLDPKELDEAIVGETFDEMVVYSMEKIIEILMKVNSWSDDEAQDWFDYNISSSFDGKMVFVYEHEVHR